MKKQFLLLTGLLCINTAFAQTQKGNKISSGSLSLGYVRQEYPFTFSDQGPTSRTTTVTPALTVSAGRFWIDNWLVGLSLSGSGTFTRQNTQAMPDRTYPNTASFVSATPFVRRYWQTNSLYLFAGAGFSVAVNSSVQSYFDSKGQLTESGIKSSVLTINPRLEVGATYFLTRRLGLQLVASSNALPLATACLNTGLVYWAGPNPGAASSEGRANPQTDRGRWVIEGNLSVISQKNSHVATADNAAYDSRSSIYSFSPSIGSFVKKNTLIGIGFPITYLTNHLASPDLAQDPTTIWSVGVAPYIQHYWTLTRLTPYTRVSAMYQQQNGTLASNRQFSGGISVGLAYMAGQRFIIETTLANASVSYLPADRVNGAGKIKTWGGQLSAGLTGNFAIRYVL